MIQVSFIVIEGNDFGTLISDPLIQVRLIQVSLWSFVEKITEVVCSYLHTLNNVSLFLCSFLKRSCHAGSSVGCALCL